MDYAEREGEITVVKEVSQMTTIEGLGTGTASGWWQCKTGAVRGDVSFPHQPNSISIQCFFAMLVQISDG